jgi:hypothetical protein
MPPQSIVDDQAQHTHGTSIHNYGLLRYFPTFQHIKYELPFHSLTISQIWQWVLEIAPINEAWRDMVMASELRPVHYFADLAFEHARYAVCSHYKLNPHQTDLQHHVHTILSAKPFLCGPQVSCYYITIFAAIYVWLKASSSEAVIGDDVLKEVLQVLLFGLEKLHPVRVMPRKKLGASEVAKAVTLVCSFHLLYCRFINC